MAGKILVLKTGFDSSNNDESVVAVTAAFRGFGVDDEIDTVSLPRRESLF